jgi:arylsulfatase
VFRRIVSTAAGEEEGNLQAGRSSAQAGHSEHTDHYIGELIAFLKEMGEYENTLIMVISDTAPR